MTTPTLRLPPCIIDDRVVKAFTISATSMRCAAWVLNVEPIALESPDPRGDDVVIDGLPGQIPYRREPNRTQWSLDLVINGFWKPDGTEWTDPEVGFETNLAALRVLLDPYNVGDGTRPASMTMPSAAVRTGPVTPLGIKNVVMAGLCATAKANLSLPNGKLT